MHADWIDFLKTQDLLAQTPTDTQAILAPLTHLTVLTVSGKDAASFLQGQTTCDINSLVDSKPGLGVYCNAKGRAITSFIIINNKHHFSLFSLANYSILLARNYACMSYVLTYN